MQTTGNYGLKKPEGNDVVNIDDLNYNADVIDVQLKTNADNLTNHSSSKQTHGVSGSFYLAKTTRSDQLPSWADIPDKPSSFNPSTHTHTKSQITDFAHKATHASGGSDAITPADIGAETPVGAQAKVDVHASTKASSSALGHVKQGDGITIDSNGVINANVLSVAGKTGNVALTKADVGLGNVDNMSATAIRTDSTRPIQVYVDDVEPLNPANGQIWYDEAVHKFKGYINGQWEILGGENMISQASNTVQVEKTTEISTTASSTAYFYGLFVPQYDGTIKIKADLRGGGGSPYSNLLIYAKRQNMQTSNNIFSLNSFFGDVDFYTLALGTLFNINDTNFTYLFTFLSSLSTGSTNYVASERIVCVKQGEPLLFFLNTSSGGTAFIRNFKICYDVVEKTTRL